MVSHIVLNEQLRTAGFGPLKMRNAIFILTCCPWTFCTVIQRDVRSFHCQQKTEPLPERDENVVCR